MAAGWVTTDTKRLRFICQHHFGSECPNALKMRDFRRITEALPVVNLGRHHARLTPTVHSIVGFPVIKYTLSSQYARIYSKHRQDRGDAPALWRGYRDESGNPWEYLSGPGAKRMARVSAGSKKIDVDASEKSGDESSDTESSDADSNVTVDMSNN